MSEALDPDLKLALARAFDLAWAGYFLPGRVTISQDVARPTLANYLVQMAKDGVTEEGDLAAAGISHLISLTGKLSD